MADVQDKFITFHDTIRLGTYKEDATLREKRERVVRALRDGLKKNFEAKNQTPPDFKDFAQGSYGMRTGIKPLGGSGDYDIDVGIVFAKRPEDYEHNPVVLKEWVYEALKDHTGNVRIRTSCVTVTYAAGYHVDLAVYAHPDKNIEGELPLAKGTPGSAEKRWQINEPRRLRKEIHARFADQAERKQFRRVIRYLKRWRDERYRSARGDAAPVGVGMTIAGLTMFTPRVDALAKTQDDLRATREFVETMLANFRDFQYSPKDGASGRRLVVIVPFQPGTDVFNKMTNGHMATFEERLKKLRDALQEAEASSSRKKACAALRRQLGDDFPEGEDEDSDKSAQASRVMPAAFIPSNVSG
ncbi:cyclic GMP-AMP synthase DncV-like nucleotidyltransferase [Deinococcus petrolearius]|uniref:Cyclic GMP-AMP synthase n=1 Tax=Deinococcus petrolearius TaxID=1751295 RepID=A0ABW1DLP9_9DEIO